MQSDVLELKRIIETLRGTDTHFRVFGSKSHQYSIGPTLSDAEIRNFEDKHAITLPEDYRLYLQLVGNGSGRPVRPHPYNSPWMTAGAGPGYGIYSLSETIVGENISQPFPFQEQIEVPYESPYDTWEDHVPGLLEICTQGCSTHTHLAVKGPTFGTVWEGFDYDHFVPTHQTFTQWMRNWAERALRILANELLLDKIAVGMTKEQVTAAIDGRWKERKNEHAPKYYFEAPGIPAQLVLSGENGTVVQINRWPFI